jgi:glycosyltransferase involved in cell wall biosynthesis
MKVVHFWKIKSGGGSVSMYRLHSGLRKAGVNSKILCRSKTPQSRHVEVFEPQLPVKIAEKLLEKVTSRLGLGDIHLLTSFPIKRHPTYRSADLLHFHGTHGFVNYLALPALMANKPAVYTLKDMWLFTGHCGYSFDCNRWKTGCGQCPYLETPPEIKTDGTALEWKLKDWIYRQLDLTLICPSKWIAELAAASPLTNRFPIHHIPHGIDTEVFRPLDFEKCRSELGIPLDKKVLMFASIKLTDPRKGCDLLIEALQNLPQALKTEIVLLVFGQEAKSLASTVGIPVYDLGYLSEDRAKAVAYSAADLFLFPTRADVFGLVSLESQACGTPVVSFRVGGVPDHVRPGITGYLARAEDAQDFRHGIVQLLEDTSLRDQMSQQCPAIAEQAYSLTLYAQRHIALYEQLLVA